MTQFRIGGVYKNGYGDGPWRITDIRVGDGYALRNVNSNHTLKAFGWSLQDGSWLADSNRRATPKMHLIPGELHQVDGAWVPMEAEPDSFVWLLGAEDDDENMPMHARDSIGVPALTWATTKPADRFEGYQVSSGTAKPDLGCAFKCGWPNDCCQTRHSHSSPLQRLTEASHLVDPRHALAAVKG